MPGKFTKTRGRNIKLKKTQMKISFNLLIVLIFLSISACGYALESNNIQMFDVNRNRTIPITMYQGKNNDTLPLIIINHGYGVKNTEYSFIANGLAELGYFVVSIQHVLEADKPLARTGNLFERRKPLWEQGIKNILFVIDELKRTNAHLNVDEIILIGHSHGGDISMMFADTYPAMTSKVISLDSLRYPFPIGEDIPILRFGATDTHPDDGVVPTKGVEIIFVKDAKHSDLCDRGSEFLRTEILKSIVQFLSKN